jgi:hypothetical protein
MLTGTLESCLQHYGFSSLILDGLELEIHMPRAKTKAKTPLTEKIVLDTGMGAKQTSAPAEGEP